MEKSFLLIENIVADQPNGQPVELARLGPDRHHTVGREPDQGGIVLPSQAISRNHACFIPCGGHWFFQDLGSTNGSWINGQPVSGEVLRLLRSGDMIQLADIVIRVTELLVSGTVGKPLASCTLIVLEGNRWVGEYPVPDYGRALVVGGAGAHLEIPGLMLNASSLIIERKGMSTIARGLSTQAPALLEGETFAEGAELHDRQLLTIAQYQIYYSDPASQIPSEPVVTSSGWSSVTRSGLSPEEAISDDYGGGFLNKPSQGSLFGKPLDVQEDVTDISATVRIDPARLQQRLGGDFHPSMRSSVEQRPQRFLMNSLEERLVLVIGFFLLIALLSLLVLWLFV